MIFFKHNKNFKFLDQINPKKYKAAVLIIWSKDQNAKKSPIIEWNEPEQKRGSMNILGESLDSLMNLLIYYDKRNIEIIKNHLNEIEINYKSSVN